MEARGFFQFKIIINVLASYFLNTYIMGLRPLYILNSFSAGIDFRRQNLTFVDVRFWRIKSVPAPKGSTLQRCRTLLWPLHHTHPWLCDLLISWLCSWTWISQKWEAEVAVILSPCPTSHICLWLWSSDMSQVIRHPGLDNRANQK